MSLKPLLVILTSIIFANFATFSVLAVQEGVGIKARVEGKLIAVPTLTPTPGPKKLWELRISGFASPLGRVEIRGEGRVLLATLLADEEGSFAVDISTEERFGFLTVSTIDIKGRRTSVLEIAFAEAEKGVEAVLSPTIELSDEQILPGEVLTAFGLSTPKSRIRISVERVVEEKEGGSGVRGVSTSVFTTKSDEKGRWSLNFGSDLFQSSYLVYAQTENEKAISPRSELVKFWVGVREAKEASVRKIVEQMEGSREFLSFGLPLFIIGLLLGTIIEKERRERRSRS